MFHCVFPQAKESAHEKNTHSGPLVICVHQLVCLGGSAFGGASFATTTISQSPACSALTMSYFFRSLGHTGASLFIQKLLVLLTFHIYI